MEMKPVKLKVRRNWIAYISMFMFGVITSYAVLLSALLFCPAFSDISKINVYNNVDCCCNNNFSHSDFKGDGCSCSKICTMEECKGDVCCPSKRLKCEEIKLCNCEIGRCKCCKKSKDKYGNDKCKCGIIPKSA